jgi:hypothetical protein
MKKLLLATTVAFWAAAGPAGAVDFTLSDGHGSGPFGSVTGFFTNAADTAYVLDFNMAPNFVIDTGAHFSMTISLNTGMITETATTFAGLGLPGSPFTIQPHTSPAGYTNAPFGDFTDAVAGNCGPAGQGGCGANLWIEVTGVNPNAVGGLFNPATNLFNGSQVFAAVDIFSNLPGASNGQTFVVGLPNAPVPTQFSSVPGPIVGAGLPGLMAGCMTLLGLGRWRRKRSGVVA